jgi:hypothetical protein
VLSNPLTQSLVHSARARRSSPVPAVGYLGVTKPCGLGLNLLKSDARSGNSLSKYRLTITLNPRCESSTVRLQHMEFLLPRVITLATVRRSINTRTSHVERTEEWGWGCSASYFPRRGGTWMKHGHRRERGWGDSTTFARSLHFHSLLPRFQNACRACIQPPIDPCRSRGCVGRLC